MDNISKGDTVQYIGFPGSNTINGWTFKVAKVKDGRVFSPYHGNLQFQYLPSHLKLISKAPPKRLNSVSYISNTGAITDLALNKRTNRFEPVMWQVVITSYISGTKLLKAPNRFYNRKHAQEWAETFKARFGMGLVRYRTVARKPQ